MPAQVIQIDVLLKRVVDHLSGVMPEEIGRETLRLLLQEAYKLGAEHTIEHVKRWASEQKGES